MRPATAPRSTGTRAAQARLALVRWFDSWAGDEEEFEASPRGAHGAADAPPAARSVGAAARPSVDWLRLLPFLALHAACLAVPFVGVSPFAVGFALAAYGVRMFAITAFYHRYFSHRAFKTSRPMQFLFALLAGTAVQRGPLWWAAHHREHHRNADTEADPHSPARRGFWWSHVGWFTAREHFRTKLAAVRDLARYPELCFLDRFDVLVPLCAAAATFGVGEALARFAPGLGTDGLQLLLWGILSTVVLFHATFTINSLAHVIGERRFETRDTSRNNRWLALLTLGEGWHNNHHHYPASARQGFVRGEFDPAYWGLVLLRAAGLVWDLKPVPAAVLARRRA